MESNRNGYLEHLNSIEELTTARCQVVRDYLEVADIVANILGQYDCDGVAIVALEVALHDYFFDTMHAYDREVDRRLVEICNTDIMSEAEEV